MEQEQDFMTAHGPDAAPYERIMGKDAVAVTIPEHEMTRAIRMDRGVKAALVYISGTFALALLATATVLYKNGTEQSAAATVLLVMLSVGVVVVAAVRAYGKRASGSALHIINTRMTLATQEVFGVRLKPLDRINPNVREHFTSGHDSHDATLSTWKLTIGDDFVRCWRIG